jgi:hypothetical protein
MANPAPTECPILTMISLSTRPVLGPTPEGHTFTPVGRTSWEFF